MKQRYVAPVPFASVASVAAVTVAAGLTACTPDQPEDPSTYSLGAGDTYVALGDSYTAAPGTGAEDRSDGCHRSAVNYPHRIAEETGLELVDNSCAGASSSSLTKPQVTARGTHPAQLDGVDEDTDLVTIRIGANDFGMFARIILCVAQHRGESGSPCTDQDAAAGERSVASRLAEMEHNLVLGLLQIRRKAPDARILVIGYPQIVPAEGTCELLPIPEGDYPFARGLMDGFNTALASAAEEARVEFVDVATASEGHDICSDEPWVAGIEVLDGGATPWHPYAQESQAVAQLVLEELE